MTDWEDRCKQCGKCCYFKIYYLEEQEYELDTRHCAYLNPNTNKCQIYKDRFKINPECVKLTEENVRTFKWLPKDCGYATEPSKSSV